MEGTAFSILNDRIYCVDVKGNGGNFFFGYPDYEHNLWAAKIDAVSGQLIDSKSYLDLRVQTSQFGFTILNYLYANLVYTGNDSFIFSDRHEKFDHSQHGVKKATIDTIWLFIMPFILNIILELLFQKEFWLMLRKKLFYIVLKEQSRAI